MITQLSTKANINTMKKGELSKHHIIRQMEILNIVMNMNTWKTQN
jgi:hypothetical protein